MRASRPSMVVQKLLGNNNNVLCKFDFMPGQKVEEFTAL